MEITKIDLNEVWQHVDLLYQKVIHLEAVNKELIEMLGLEIEEEPLFLVRENYFKK